MSTPHFPSETVDHIVDFLHDSKLALRSCSLVSKSWIPRSRSHLFADVSLHTKNDLELWREIFPDPLTSPARYTKTLFVDCTEVVADPEVGGWLRGFSGVVRLRMDNLGLLMSKVSLVPFHGFSPIKSLRVDSFIPPSQLFNLILSFRLLEDLTLTAGIRVLTMGPAPNEPQTVLHPSNSPPCTGSLLLSKIAMEYIAYRLLSLPGGIHFRKLTLSWLDEEQFSLATALVEACSHTLEYLDISCISDCASVWHLGHYNSSPAFLDQSRSTSIDLSNATRLKGVAFEVDPPDVDWIAMELQSITPKHQDLQQISIHLPGRMIPSSADTDTRERMGETIYGQWLDIDRILVQFWELRSIRPRVVCLIATGAEPAVGHFVGSILPEATRSGIIDLLVGEGLEDGTT